MAWLGSKAAAAHVARVAECAKKFDDYSITVSKNGKVTAKKGLKKGEWRYLSEGESNILKMGAYL